MSLHVGASCRRCGDPYPGLNHIDVCRFRFDWPDWKRERLLRLGDRVLLSPTLLELGLLVTVCIAAHSADKCFVAVADRMLSFQTSNQFLPGTDNATGKAFNLGWGWYALAAGDIGLAKSIAEHALGILYAMVPRPIGLASRAQIERAFRGGFSRIWKERAGDEVLSRYGVTWRDFRRMKDSKLRAQIVKRLDRYELRVGLLVFGMDDNRTHHLFVIRSPGVIEERGYLGYWAIGSGTNTALAALAVRWTQQPSTYVDLIYRLCEAKFSCEGVEGIGQMTNVLFTSDRQGPLMELHPKYVDQLRIIWERERRSAVPPDALAVIAEALNNTLQ